MPRYVLSFPAAANHNVEVEAVFPANGALDLMMAVWTPGSYMVREYSRQVEGMTATHAAGQVLSIDKVAKNRWRINAAKGDVTVRYRVYCREMTVRTAWVEADFALLNGAPIFVTRADGQAEPHEVQLVLPPAWKSSLTALRPGKAAHHYIAQNFDELVDSPILLGNPVQQSFELDGHSHVLAHAGDPALWDTAKATQDVEKLVREVTSLWGVIPYERYVFLNLVTEGKGGLEHRASTVMMTSRFAMRSRKDYVDWLGLVSHEFFHTWNVKRLRPKTLGPFNYEAEAYTPTLWVVEGFTAYYDDLLVHRAGLATRAEYFERLGKTIEQLQSTPGRLVQTLERSSFDAWIKQYRPDENSINTAISYYVKGAVVAFLLDARLRQQSDGRTSLDIVLRRAYERYAGERGYTRDELLALIDEVAQTALSTWLMRLLTTTDELDYSEALAFYGLRFKEPKKPKTDEAEEPRKSYLGLTTRNDAGRLLVTQVLRDTPAHAAGLNVDDEIVAIDELRVWPEQWEERLKVYPPGTALELLIGRRQRLQRLRLTTVDKPTERWKLEEDPHASEAAKAQLKAWLSPSRGPA